MEPTKLLLLRVNSPLVSDGGGSGHVTIEERNKDFVDIYYIKPLYSVRDKKKCSN